MRCSGQTHIFIVIALILQPSDCNTSRQINNEFLQCCRSETSIPRKYFRYCAYTGRNTFNRFSYRAVSCKAKINRMTSIDERWRITLFAYNELVEYLRCAAGGDDLRSECRNNGVSSRCAINCYMTSTDGPVRRSDAWLTSDLSDEMQDCDWRRIGRVFQEAAKRRLQSNSHAATTALDREPTTKTTTSLIRAMFRDLQTTTTSTTTTPPTTTTTPPTTSTTTTTTPPTTTTTITTTTTSPVETTTTTTPRETSPSVTLESTPTPTPTVKLCKWHSISTQIILGLFRHQPQPIVGPGPECDFAVGVPSHHTWVPDTTFSK